MVDLVPVEGGKQEEQLMIEEERKASFPNHKAQQLKLYRDYTYGKHCISLTDGQKKILQGITRKQFADNLCKRIVSTVAARVRVDRFDVAGKRELEFLQDLWTLNWGRQLVGRVHFSAVRDGNHAVSLGWNNVKQRVVLSRELWWNGKRGVFVAYDGEGEARYAVKEWPTFVLQGGKAVPATRRVVWFPNRIERLVRIGGAKGWSWWTHPAIKDARGNIIRDEERPGPQWWTDTAWEDGQPLGIACVHFARMDKPGDLDAELDAGGAVDNYGESILAGGVLGINDAINDLHMSILAAARMNAYQRLFLAGVALEDENGEPIDYEMEIGKVIAVDDADAEATVLEAGDLSQLISALEKEHEAAATSCNVPIHAIRGDWPSGEALIQADRPLVDQAESLADSFGPAWSSVAHRAMQIANAFGGSQLDTTSPITTIFKPAERSDQLTLSAVAEKIAPFVSQREVLRILRYPPERIEEIMREKRRESQEMGFSIPGASNVSDGATTADDLELDEDAA
jgi:hypothetical protein